MKKLYFILLLVLPILIFDAKANNVKVENITFNQSNLEVSFDLSWENSWNFGDYHDAVWVFVKYNPNNIGSWLHAKIDSTGCSSSSYDLEFAEDNMGIYVKRRNQGQGNNNSASVTLKLDGPLQGIFPDIKVYGIEMVNVPEGAFYFGDNYSFYSLVEEVAVKNNLVKQPILINDSPNPFLNKQLKKVDFPGYYTNKSSIDLVDSFPTGYNRFYCMKYEITQGQYVDFLNSLSFYEQTIFSNFTSNFLFGENFRNASTFRQFNYGFLPNDYNNGITFDQYKFSETGELVFYCDLDADNNYNDPDDGMTLAAVLDPVSLNAYLNWSGLRPMTEMEYEKACRGPIKPSPGDLAWGSSSFIIVDDYYIRNLNGIGTDTFKLGDIFYGPLIYLPIRNGICASDTIKSRIVTGGSFYGIMELSNSVAEFVIPIYEDLNSNQSYNFKNGDGEIYIFDNYKSNPFFIKEFYYKGEIINPIYSGPSIQDNNEFSISGRSDDYSPFTLNYFETYYNDRLIKNFYWGGRGVRTHNK